MKRFRIVLKRIETIETIIETEVDEPKSGCTSDLTAKVNVLKMAKAGKLELNFNKDNNEVTYELSNCEEIRGMKIIWQEQDGKEKSWEGDFEFEDLGSGVRVTDKVTGKAKCFFGEYKVIR